MVMNYDKLIEEKQNELNEIVAIIGDLDKRKQELTRKGIEIDGAINMLNELKSKKSKKK